MTELPSELDWRRLLPESPSPVLPDAEMLLFAVAVELDHRWPEPATELRDRVRTQRDVVLRTLIGWQDRRYDQLMGDVDYQPYTTRPERSAVEILLRWLQVQPADFQDLAGVDDLIRMALRRHGPGPTGRRPWLQATHWWWSYPDAPSPAAVTVQDWINAAARSADAPNTAASTWLWELHRLLRDDPSSHLPLANAIRTHASDLESWLSSFLDNIEFVLVEAGNYRAGDVVQEHLDHLRELTALAGPDALELDDAIARVQAVILQGW